MDTGVGFSTDAGVGVSTDAGVGVSPELAPQMTKEAQQRAKEPPPSLAPQYPAQMACSSQPFSQVCGQFVWSTLATFSPHEDTHYGKPLARKRQKIGI
ncbi:unnamed protein product [Linum trigynum]|uniref:Uncharacterized protein n=1 Tax=Linum trigynum TaxID=586398 RepID=A0AAV2D790_9ROSI